MHSQSLSRRPGARLLLLLVVALMAAAAVAAAPAAALPTPTVLTVSAQSPTVTWGSTAILNGVLQTAVDPIESVNQQQVRVEYSSSSIPLIWPLAGMVTNNAAPYASAEYTYPWQAIRTYYWRMNFEGTDQWAGYVGNYVLVKVTAAIGKPACPSSIKAGKKFTVSGSLKPKYPAGAKTVTVKAQRYSSGKWRSYKSYAATNANSGSYTKYSVRVSISKKGKYRFYATTKDSSTLAAGRSANSRTLRVK
jgi:hypothetical protein